MPTLSITDYRTYQENGRANSLSFLFDLPADFVSGTSQSIPVLMFRLRSQDDCKVWIHVNDAADVPKGSNASVILDLVGGTGDITQHELLKGTLFLPNRSNKITIRKAPGAPKTQLLIADVVLMFQRRVTF